MPALVIPDCFELSVHGDVRGQEIVAVFHYFKTGGITAGEAATAATAFNSTVLPSYLNLLSVGYTARKIVAKNLHTAGGPEFELPLTSGNIGGRGGAVAPGNVCIAISWRSSSATRSGRGRTYLGPLATADLSGDTISPTLANLIATFGNTIVSTGLVSGARFGIASRRHLLVQLVLSFVLDAILDSMRRRLTERGR